MKLLIEISVSEGKYKIRCNNNQLLTADLELLKQYVAEQINIWSGYSVNILKNEAENFKEQLIISKAELILSKIKEKFPDIDTKKRDGEIIYHRHCLCHYLSVMGISQKSIAQILNRDRTTIFHSLATYEREIGNSKQMQNANQDIMNIIGEYLH